MSRISPWVRGFAAIGFVAALWPAAASAATVRIMVDGQGGAPLCIVVQDGAPFAAPPGAMITPRTGASSPPPVPMQAGTFYPVSLAACGAPSASATWTTTDTRELRVTARGQPLCLSLRTREAFAPLVQPFLRALGADGPASPLASLAARLTAPAKGAGEVGLPVLASPCGRADASDFWVYDHLTGTVASPGRSLCLSTGTGGDRSAAGPQAGTPVVVTRCGDLRAYTRDGTSPRQRWTVSDDPTTWPTYRPQAANAYFDGSAGLPIAGPMGRCLTVEAGKNVVVTSDCDNRIEQDWVFTGRSIQLGGTDRCLARLESRALMRRCDGSPGQGWSYDNPDPMPNGRWRNAEIYARIHPDGEPASCLSVAEDPFVDPSRQNNPVRVVACGATKPRQVSWFVPDKVRTVRVGLLRYANDDGSKPANGAASDDDLRRLMVTFALRLSEHYRGLGVRFIFAPDHDYAALRDTFVNEVNSTRPDGSTDWTTGNRIAAVATTRFRGRATVAILADYQGGGSSGGLAEFEVARMRNLITGAPETSYTTIPGLPRDPNGLPAVSMSVTEGFVGNAVGTMSHHAHEFGHFFGLGHTFDPDLFGDTPDDLVSGDPWGALGSSTCGNLRTVTFKGRTVTPDRLNNEGYFGCQIGRTRNAFSPLQLGYMDWQLNHFLNRYPLVACQPTASYDGNHVECENEESLVRCRETAAALRSQYGADLDCRRGGRYVRAMAEDEALPAVRFLLDETGPGRALIARLAGGKPGETSPAQIGAVKTALAAGSNLPLTMAIVHRIDEYRAAAVLGSPPLARSGFTPSGALTAADRRVLLPLAATTFTAGFIENVPRLLSAEPAGRAAAGGRRDRP